MRCVQNILALFSRMRNAVQPDISQAVASVMKLIRSVQPKGGVVSFDFTGNDLIIVSLVQKVLIDRGFRTLIAISSDSERMYIDASMKAFKKKKNS